MLGKHSATELHIISVLRQDFIMYAAQDALELMIFLSQSPE